MTKRLRVVVASPLSEELCGLIERREPRVEVVRDQTLLYPQRHPGDHIGDRSRKRTPEQQDSFDRLVDSADALYGVPDESARALKRTVEANPALRWVHTTVAGGGAQVRAARLGQADLERIRFTTSAGIHADQLAEYALFAVLAGVKSLPRLQQLQRDKVWADRWAMGTLGAQTVVVVGLGNIGKRTAEVFTSFGARVIGVHRREVEASVEQIVPVAQFADAMAQADAVVLALPGTEQTNGMLSREVLANAKPGVTIVNVGRGSTVDEEALIAALADGRVGFAALDVVAKEPLPPESPLWSMPNVLISPHNAALTPEEDLRIAEMFAENARRLLDGEPLINPVNTVEFY